jgi:hypothetical protein
VKGNDRVTFSLGETTAPGDDNRLLPAQFAGRFKTQSTIHARPRLDHVASVIVNANDGMM